MKRRPRGFLRLRLWHGVGAALLALGVLAANVPGHHGQVVAIVIPAGTQARVDRGEIVTIVPDRIELRVGDTLRIQNDDQVAQLVGPYFVAAGADLEITYGAPGTYRGTCALAGTKSVEIVVAARNLTTP